MLDEQGPGDRVEFRVKSANDTGFENNSVDLVLSTGMLHHLSQPLKAFREIYRMLRPRGEAWLFDGRQDATIVEFEGTVRDLGIEEDIPLPLTVMERLCPRIHAG